MKLYEKYKQEVESIKEVYDVNSDDFRIDFYREGTLTAIDCMIDRFNERISFGEKQPEYNPHACDEMNGSIGADYLSKKHLQEQRKLIVRYNNPRHIDKENIDRPTCSL